jgi:hypothetical protein
VAPALAYDEDTGERLVRSTHELSDVFFDEERWNHAGARDVDDGYLFRTHEAHEHKYHLFQTRRALNALIRRGLVEAVGTARREFSQWALNRHRPPSRTYRLTDAGAELARALAARAAAKHAAWAAANPEQAKAREEAWAGLAEAFRALPK